MKLTILGCSGSVPGPDSPASGYLVESGDSRLVLDLGNGTLGALQRFADPFALDALLLSHLHPDHCADVAALTVLRRYHPDAPQDRLPLLAPEDAAARLAGLYAPSESEWAETDLSDVYEFRALPASPVRIGAFEVQALPMNHVCPSWGFRVAAEGRVLAYTGDTGFCAELADLARDVDVFLAEASWPDFEGAPPNVHLSGRQAGAVALEAGARRLLLTHVQPWVDKKAVLDEARVAYGDGAELVTAGRSYDV